MNWNGEPCGYFHAYENHPREGVFFVSMFFIIPSQSRQGLGRRAAAGIAEQAKSLGFSKILLSVFLTNRNALSFWIDQGFDRIEKFRRTEETGRPDWLVLVKNL